ncbi:MAG TPA: DNA polymerase Y family protein [Terracidiphilus sp.]
MSRELYACLHAAEFPAQALLRLRPDWKAQLVAVLDGPTHDQSICAFNRLAAQRGVVHGLSRLEAESVVGLLLLERSLPVERAAHAVLLEAAAHFSPRIEEVTATYACSFVLDVSGSELLFGPAAMIAARLREAMAATGFRVSVAVSANFHVARMKAATTRGITIIPAGEEALTLAKLPLSALNLAENPRETFAVWGIRTLGELAALPEAELVTRLGAEARVWRALARGAGRHTFQPIEAEFTLRELYEFDSPVEQMDGLLFIAARMIESLVERAAAHALSLATMSVEMKLENGAAHRLNLRPALPTADRKFLLKLLHLELAAHPPLAAVLALTMTAEPGRSSKIQLGLFAPQTPEPSHLDVTLARIKAIVGEERVGAPVLEDTHRPASFHTENFRVDAKAASYDAQPARMALRRVRPPRAIHVTLRESKPASFRDGVESYSVAAAYGPWRSNGCWWSVDAWETEEWDVLTADRDGLALSCLLTNDRLRGEWRLEALLD